MIPRVLEPELMDTCEEALAYDTMDHAEVNCTFVSDLLDAERRRTGLRPAPSDSGEPPYRRAADDWIEVLDLGTGTAQQPIELCRQWDAVRVVAIDAAENMLDVARNNIEIALLTERIMLDRVDAKQLPYDDGRFPVVMSNSIVHHIPEPIDVFREAVRVTAAGGLLFFRDLLRPESAELLAHLVMTYAGEATDHQQQLFADSLHAALSLEEVRGLVEGVGFPPESVQATSDRHWTWSANRPG